MMFTDNMVLVDENTKVQESKLERWREVVEGNKLKISRAETKFKRKLKEMGQRSLDSEVNLLIGLFGQENKRIVKDVASKIR